jgi:hypothetical protein
MVVATVHDNVMIYDDREAKTLRHRVGGRQLAQLSRASRTMSAVEEKNSITGSSVRG